MPTVPEVDMQRSEVTEPASPTPRIGLRHASDSLGKWGAGKPGSDCASVASPAMAGCAPADNMDQAAGNTDRPGWWQHGPGWWQHGPPWLVATRAGLVATRAGLMATWTALAGGNTGRVGGNTGRAGGNTGRVGGCHCITGRADADADTDNSRMVGTVLLNVLGCQLTYYGQAVTNAEAWFSIALRPRKPEGSLGRTAQDGHLDSHTAPEL